MNPGPPRIEDLALNVTGRRNLEATADLLIVMALRQAECLKWLSTIRIGVGGVPMHVAQKCASMASRGEDWKAHRNRNTAERMATASTKPSGQLPRR